MGEQSEEEKGWRVYNHPLAILWLASLFVIAPTIEWFESFVLFLCFTILPGIALLSWLVGVPLWLSWKAAVRRRWGEAVRTLSLLPIGAVIGFAGSKAGDAVAVLHYGPNLKREIEAAKQGGARSRSGGVFSSSMMAFRLTGGFLDNSEGIVYDASGKTGELLPRSPSDRPEEWQAGAVDVLTCRGSARHLYGDYWKVVVSSYSC